MTKIEKIEISGVATYHQTGPYNKESWPGVPCVHPRMGTGGLCQPPVGAGSFPLAAASAAFRGCEIDPTG